MIDQLKKAIHKIDKLPERKQIESANLIQDELSWDPTILQSPDGFAILRLKHVIPMKSLNITK
jgi:hypothetical protein